MVERPSKYVEGFHADRDIRGKCGRPHSSLAAAGLFQNDIALLINDKGGLIPCCVSLHRAFETSIIDHLKASTNLIRTACLKLYPHLLFFEGLFSLLTSLTYSPHLLLEPTATQLMMPYAIPTLSDILTDSRLSHQPTQSAAEGSALRRFYKETDEHRQFLVTGTS